METFLSLGGLLIHSKTTLLQISLGQIPVIPKYLISSTVLSVLVGSEPFVEKNLTTSALSKKIKRSGLKNW